LARSILRNVHRGFRDLVRFIVFSRGFLPTSVRFYGLVASSCAPHEAFHRRSRFAPPPVEPERSGPATHPGSGSGRLRTKACTATT